MAVPPVEAAGGGIDPEAGGGFDEDEAELAVDEAPLADAAAAGALGAGPTWEDAVDKRGVVGGLDVVKEGLSVDEGLVSDRTLLPESF